MSITYEQAVEAIVTAEKGIISSAKTVTNTAIQSVKDALAQLETIKASIPANSIYQSSVKSTIESAYSQLQSYSIQMDYIKDSLNVLDTQYNPPAPEPEIVEEEPEQTPPSE